MLAHVAAQPLGERVEPAGCGGEREVHVAAAAIAELLLPRRPQAEPGVRSGGEPDAIVLAGEDAQAEPVDVEALQRRDVARLQREFGKAVGERIHGFPAIPAGSPIACR